MTIVVGITGGIGSGKSTFSKEVKRRGLKLLDSDEEVSKIYKKPTIKFLKYLKKINLGKSIKKKKIDKKYISDIIFSDKKTKLKLESFIFKIVKLSRIKFIRKEKKRRTKIIFLDIPLLFENKLENQFDIVISIISTKKNRLERLGKSKKLSTYQFQKVVKFQTTDVIRKKNSDIVVFNNKTLQEYTAKINYVLDQILK